MKFTLNDVEGRNICMIVGGKYNGRIVKYIDDEHDLKSNTKMEYQDFTHLKLTDGKFVPYVDTNVARQVISCLGCSGCGKSYYLKMYCLSYMEEYPDRDIFLFGPFKDDVSFKELKGKHFKQVDIDNYQYEPLTLDDMPDNSLIIFDDIDVIQNKDVIKQIYKLQEQILKGGRHKNITCLCTSHVSGTQDKQTRELLLETTICTIYLGSGGNYQYLLNRYIGLTQQGITKLKNMNSRYVSIIKMYPQIYFCEKEVGFVKDLN